MRSQLRFVMHPLDEAPFIAALLADTSVQLIDGPRWPEQLPVTTRNLAQIKRSYCIIWSPQDRASLSARFIPTCNDWYCGSEQVTIQFLRSEIRGSVITEGRIAVSTNELTPEEAAGVEKRFKALLRFIKKQHRNKVLSWCNPHVPLVPVAAIAQEGEKRSPNPSSPDASCWIGPHAMQWLAQDPAHCAKQAFNARVEGRLV